ncbi:MAG: HAMP domain-containing histidine kinase [Thaumarchaeota archaeon]|nr:HAMP domain-containing histidine kinase [Nitrososphaerota archaeon]
MNDSKTHHNESTRIINGKEAILEDWIQFSLRAKKLDVYFDKNAIKLALEIPAYSETRKKIKEKGVRTRYITEITKENVSQAKVLLDITDSLRHLEGPFGGMAVSDSEFRATANFYNSVPVTQVISSSNMGFVEQQQHIFDVLWKIAIPAKQRIKEIEEGIIHQKTEMITEQDEIISAVKTKYFNPKELMLCLDNGGLQVVYNNYLDVVLKTLENEYNGFGKGVRIMTLVNSENIDTIKEFLRLGVKVRHVTHLPPMNFSCSEQHVFLTVEEIKLGQHATRMLSSNESSNLIHFTSIFEKFWKNGIDAEKRVADIERGGTAEDIEIIYNSSQTREIYTQLLLSAQKEIKIIYPTVNAFLRQNKFHVPQMLTDAAKQRRVNVRVIAGDKTMMEYLEPFSGFIQIRFLERSSETKATFLIVDNKYILDMEIRDDSKNTFEDAIGFAIYSSSKASVHSHVAIFDNLWIQAKMYEELKESSRLLEIINRKLEKHYNTQKDFITIAAHELRTPIQPILGLSEVLKSNISSQFEIQMINVIVKNALRLQTLAENLLDVSRIEGGMMSLKKEEMDLGKLVRDIVDNFRYQISTRTEKKELKIQEEIKSEIIIFADRLRITQVLTNLLNNAIFFTDCGTINVTIDKNIDNAIIDVMDTGTGIPENILTTIFDKFITKSDGGTGIGLFITKGIVEKHGGRIHAKNNPDGHGARFTITLPMTKGHNKCNSI